MISLVNRKTCQICKARRNIKFMRISKKHWRNSDLDKYVCDDLFCGRAWENQYHINEFKLTSQEAQL